MDLPAAVALARAQAALAGSPHRRLFDLLVLLTARGVAIDSDTCARILAERDAQRLDRWIVRAASCTQVAELFTDG